MRTLRQHFLSVYKLALDSVISHIEKRGFITSLAAEHYFQKHIDRFEKYYVKKHKDLEPFSEEFIGIIFTDFHDYIEKDSRIKVIRLSEEEQNYVDYWEIYGFDEKIMKGTHDKDYKRKKREQEKEREVLQQCLNKKY